MRRDGYALLREILLTRDFKHKHGAIQVMAVCYFDTKARFSMIREKVDKNSTSSESDGGEILVRANQGHTMRVVDEGELLTLLEDPEEFVGEAIHGTYLVHWPFIRRQGLSKAARNHIHLACTSQKGGTNNMIDKDANSEGAGPQEITKGMRSNAEVFIYVDIKKAMGDGMIFFQSKNEVVLTPGDEGWLAPKYFKKVIIRHFLT